MVSDLEEGGADSKEIGSYRVGLLTQSLKRVYRQKKGLLFYCPQMILPSNISLCIYLF